MLDKSRDRQVDVGLVPQMTVFDRLIVAIAAGDGDQAARLARELYLAAELTRAYRVRFHAAGERTPLVRYFHVPTAAAAAVACRLSHPAALVVDGVDDLGWAADLAEHNDGHRGELLDELARPPIVPPAVGADDVDPRDVDQVRR